MEAAVITAVGKTMLINTMTNLYVFLNETENVDHLIEELDIESELKLVETLIMEIKVDTNTIELCIEQLQKIINEIHQEFDCIEKEMKIHKTRYFYYYRIPNCIENIENLKLLKKEMKDKTDRLLQISKIVVEVENKHNNFLCQLQKVLESE